MTFTTKQREQYNHNRKITCDRLGITKNTYNYFRRLGEQLHKIYEDSCNGVIDTEEEYEIATSPICAQIDSMARDLDLYVFYQTDPRGATIYLSKNEISEDSYNIDAECIY